MLVVSVVAACTERSVGLPPQPTTAGPVPLASSQAPSYCTRTWVGLTDGDWGDSSRWSPFGLPASSDTVCILTRSRVTLRADDGPFSLPTQIMALQLGDGRTAPMLHVIDSGSSSTHLYVASWVSVREGSRLGFAGRQNLFHADSVDNRGVIAVAGLGLDSVSISTRKLINSGNMLLWGRTHFELQFAIGGFVNLGYIDVRHPDVTMKTWGFAPGVSSFVHAAGIIQGSHPLRLTSTISSDELEWTGGIIDSVPGSSGLAALVATGYDVALDRVPPGSGFLDLRGRPHEALRVTGDVPPGVRIALGGDSAYFYFGELNRPSPVIHGTLALGGATNTFSVSRLENRHRLELLDAVALRVDTIVNRGTIDLSASPRLTVPNARLLNAGSIVASTADGVLRMPATTTFIATPTGRLSAPLVLDGGTLTGDGPLGAVTSIGGTIAPGAPIGTLAPSSLVLDGGSNLLIDVAGDAPSQHDRLAVAGNVTLGGKLIVTTIPPFLGGTCGQAIPFLTDGSTAPRGAFGQLLGLTFLGTPRQWRVHATAGAHVLTGFNPFVPFTFSSTAIVAREGGSIVPLHACLGSGAPQAPVTVTLASALGQASATPSAVTFTTADWALPLTFALRAIDDAIVERTVQDTLRPTLASADPYYGGRWVASPIVDVHDDDGNADLSIAFDDAADTLQVGDATGFRVLITNHGPTAITGGAFTLPALTGLTVQSVTGPAGCTWSATRIDCPVDPLASGATQVITIRVVAVTVGSHPTRVRVSSDQPDPSTPNDSATWTFVVR